MKFKLPRPIPNKEVYKIASKAIRKQKIDVVRANKNKLKELAHVSRMIVKRCLPTNLVCKKLPKGVGYGIFLHPKASPILKGQIIASYAGEIGCVAQSLPEESLYIFELVSDIVLSREEQAYFDGSRRYSPRRLYSIQVDALKKGNFTRFINHSEKPNVIAELFRIPPNSFGLAPSPIEVVYLAKKTILPGEQLLVSYDKSYWRSLGIKPIPITPKTYQLNSSLKLISSI